MPTGQQQVADPGFGSGIQDPGHVFSALRDISKCKLVYLPEILFP